MFQENEIRFQLKSVLQLDMLFWPALEQLATALQYSYFSVMSLKQCSVFEILGTLRSGTRRLLERGD